MTITYPEFGSSEPAATEKLVGIALPVAVSTEPQPGGFYRHFLKRALDVTAILLAAPFILPMVGLLALMVSRDGGSVFYTQQRVGRGGRAFRMWKLRTMVSDADERLEMYLQSNPEARREWDETQKLKSDPRITRAGHFLRRASLDEVPQLWNVFVGDMSLVGPRPMMLNQQALYPGKAYFTLRPGITGYWQTAGRNKTTFEARVDFDDDYARDLSLWTDIKVLARTVGVVMRCTGY